MSKDQLFSDFSPVDSKSWKQKMLKPGDIILKVAQGKEEPVDIVNMRIKDAVKLIRGEKGTEVTLTIIRMDVEEPFDVVIKRDKINVESVTHEMLDGDVMYVSINQFSDNTTEEFDEAVQQMLLLRC